MKAADKPARVAMFYPLACRVRQTMTANSEHQCSNEIMKVLFSAESPVGLAVFDAAFRCQILNARLSAMIGQEIDACLGKHVDEIFCNLAPQIKASLQEASLTGNSILHCELSGDKPGTPSDIGHWTVSFFPIVDQDGIPQQFVMVILDITLQEKAKEALIQSEAMLRTLSGQLLSVQDEERRRLARELHDGVGQYLSVLKIKLEANMGRLLLDSRLAKLLADSAVLVDECLRETRTIAYLLHPPLLDQMGLPSALRWYVDGFAERSGINMNLDIAPGFARLPIDVETALFRVVQESLTNIHRHSGSTTASIRLELDAESVSLEVKDLGTGIPPEKLQYGVDEKGAFGMGITSMKERIRQFGGRLTLHTGHHGTTVTATLPIEAGE